MEEKHTQDTKDRTPSKMEERKQESAPADRAELTANKPLRILNDELGGDPYNHTGRFSRPTDE